jgi:hypothetical protein
MSDNTPKRSKTGQTPTTTTTFTTTTTTTSATRPGVNMTADEKILPIFNACVRWASIGYHINSAENTTKYGPILTHFRAIAPQISHILCSNSIQKPNTEYLHLIGSLDIRFEFNPDVVSRLILEWSRHSFTCYISVYDPKKSRSVLLEDRFDVIFTFRMTLPAVRDNAIIHDTPPHPLIGFAVNPSDTVTDIDDIMPLYEMSAYNPGGGGTIMSSFNLQFRGNLENELSRQYGEINQWMRFMDSIIVATTATSAQSTALLLVLSKAPRGAYFPQPLMNNIYDAVLQKATFNYHELPKYVIRPTVPSSHDLTTEQKRVYVRSAIMDLLALNPEDSTGISAHITTAGLSNTAGNWLVMDMKVDKADGAPGPTDQRFQLHYWLDNEEGPRYDLQLFSTPADDSNTTASASKIAYRVRYIEMEIHKFNHKFGHSNSFATQYHNYPRITFPTNKNNDETTNLLTETMYYPNPHYAHNVFLPVRNNTTAPKRFDDTLEVNSSLKDNKGSILASTYDFTFFELNMQSFYNEISIHALYHALHPWIVELRKLGLGRPPSLPLVQAVASRITFSYTKPSTVASSTITTTTTTTTTPTNLNATAKMNTAKPSSFSKLEKLPFK